MATKKLHNVKAACPQCNNTVQHVPSWHKGQVIYECRHCMTSSTFEDLERSEARVNQRALSNPNPNPNAR